MKKKKGSRSLDQIARTFSLFVPPQKILAPAATDGITETRLALFLSTIVLKSIKVCPSPGIYMYINHTRNLDSGELCVQRLSAGTSRV